jgi:hypothetical protein
MKIVKLNESLEKDFWKYVYEDPLIVIFSFMTSGGIER